MSIYELFHYSLFPALFAFTYNKKEPPAFGAAPSFWCILHSFLGLLFCHIPNNLSNYNVLTANAPFFYQISGTWSNHEGSILLWCRIPSFYGLLLGYRRSQRHNQKGHRETLICFVLVKNSILSLPRYQVIHEPQLYTLLRTLTELCSRRNRTFDGLIGSFSLKVLAGLKSLFRGSREAQRRKSLHLARYEKERASSIDEQRIGGALGIACFFFPFLSASSDPFVRNFFVRTEPLAESNPVPQDPISAIHPPCIYAGEVASAIGFGLCRSKMMNGIAMLHSLLRKDAEKSGGTLLGSAGGSVGSRITSELFTLQHFEKCYPALLLRRNAILLMLLRRRVFALSSLWTTRSLVGECVVRNGKIAALLFTANTVVSDQEPIRIWILTCRWFLTVGILPGSWWAHHELGRGGWWFRDPVENASFMPRVLATARIHSVMLPLLHSWTFFLNIVTFLCCLLGTSSIRSGLLAPVHSFSTDTRGIFLWRFFLLMTGISISVFSLMKQQASVRITYQKDMVVLPTRAIGFRATSAGYVLEELGLRLAGDWLHFFTTRCGEHSRAAFAFDQ